MNRITRRGTSQAEVSDWPAGAEKGLGAVAHFHCCVIDGVFAAGVDGEVQFAEAAALRPEDLAAVQQQVRQRVPRWFSRAGHLDNADARDVASWDHGGGFSLDASIRASSVGFRVPVSQLQLCCPSYRAPTFTPVGDLRAAGRI